MNTLLQSIQNMSWDLKEACDDLAPRKLTGPDLAILESVERDLARLQAKVIAVRDKHKRARKNESTPAPAAEPSVAQGEQAPLGGVS